MSDDPGPDEGFGPAFYVMLFVGIIGLFGLLMTAAGAAAGM